MQSPSSNKSKQKRKDALPFAVLTELLRDIEAQGGFDEDHKARFTLKFILNGERAALYAPYKDKIQRKVQRLKAYSRETYLEVLDDHGLRSPTGERTLREAISPSSVDADSPLRSISPPHSIFSGKMASIHLDEDLPEYDVNVKRFGSYPEGLLGINVPLVSVGQQGIAEAFDLFLPVAHPYDLDLISMVLLQDGQTIRVTVATVPTYVISETDEMLESEKILASKRQIFCPVTEVKRRACARKIANAEHLQTRSFLLKLSHKCRPAGEKWTKNDGHAKSGGWELKTCDYYFQSEYKELGWPVCYAYWRIQVDDTYEETNTSLEQEEDLHVTSMIASMQLAPVKRTPKRITPPVSDGSSQMDMNPTGPVQQYECKRYPKQTVRKKPQQIVRKDPPALFRQAADEVHVDTSEFEQKKQSKIHDLQERAQQLKKEQVTELNNLKRREQELQLQEDEIQAQVERLEADLNMLREYKEDRERDFSQQNEKLSSLKKKEQEVRLEGSLQLQDLSTLEQQIKSNEVKIAELEKNRTEKDRQLKDLLITREQQIKNEEVKLAKLEKDRTEQDRQLQDLEQRLLELARCRQNVTEDLDKAKDQIKGKEMDLARLEGTCLEPSRVISGMQHEKEQLQSEDVGVENVASHISQGEQQIIYSLLSLVPLLDRKRLRDSEKEPKDEMEEDDSTAATPTKKTRPSEALVPFVSRASVPWFDFFPGGSQHTFPVENID